jgi:phenylalanyl-tRNA synthetase alpha chain
MKMLFSRNDMRFRWVETTFPFTRPSLEMEIHASCIPGMQVKEGEEWLEVLGCGVVNQDILTEMGHPYDSGMGWAFGIGIERIAMLYFGISDIRVFWNENPAFLANFQENGMSTTYRPLSPHHYA